MKHVLIISITSLSATLCIGQSSNENNFIRTLKNAATALAKRDSVALSRYIDPKTGVYILHRIGVVDTYGHFATLGFGNTAYPQAPFYDDVKLTPLKYATLPTFDCEKWTKTGTFVDTTRTDRLLSKIAKGLNKERKRKIPAETVNAFYNLENKSRRVVIADNNRNELIIYLSFISGKWVLTIIDKVTCDCSV